MIFIRTSILSYILISSLLQPETYTQGTDVGQRRHYCGKTLVKTLSLVCHAKYNKPNGKRYLDDNYDDDFAAGVNPNYEGPISFFDQLTRRQLYDSEVPRYRVSKGVVNECCYNPCSYSTLQTYCS